MLSIISCYCLRRVVCALQRGDAQSERCCAAYCFRRLYVPGETTGAMLHAVRYYIRILQTATAMKDLSAIFEPAISHLREMPAEKAPSVCHLLHALLSSVAADIFAIPSLLRDKICHIAANILLAPCRENERH